MKTSANFCKWLIVSAFAVFAATTLSQAQPSNGTPSPTGLVSWWKAEGNGLDSINGNSAYAALLPGGATFAPGEVGQAFQLDNTNAYLFVPASPSLDVGAGSGLTMEGWIKVSSVSGFHPIAEWHGDTRETAGVQLWLNSYPTQSGALFGAVTDTNFGQHTLVSASDIIQPNVFQHVALTYDKTSGIGTLYLNGAVVAQVNLGSFVPATTSDLWIAHRPLDVPGDWTYGTTLGGLLDELSIYSRALSSNEIAAIYNAGSAGKCDANNSSMAPAITHQPANQTATVGDTAAFSVTATGSSPLYYQWYGPGSSIIVGAVNSTLTLSNVQPGNAGSYFVLVTNANGFAQSSNTVLTVTGGITNSCTPAPSGLVSLWKGDGNPGDSAGNNNGFVTGGSISYTVGKVNSAFHYADGSGYVEVPAASSLNVGQGAGFTIEAWIQPADIVNEIPILEWQYNTNNSYSGAHFWISAIGGAGCLFANIVDSTNNSHWFFSAPGIVTSDYQHVALTYDKSTGIASIYRNGLLVARTNLGSFTPNTTGNLLLGERTYLGGNPQFHYVGNLDEMSLYDRALSQSEIQAIYTADSAGKCGGVTNSGTAPVITHQPTNQTVSVGSAAAFSVTATGSSPLRYQWFGPASALIPGATTSTLTLSNVQPGNAGSYFVLVTNAYGFAQSSNAVLTVTGGGGNTNSCTPPPSGLVSWWPGEGNANDVVGGNNGTLVNGVGFAAGEVGQGFLFTHTNQNVLIPANSNLDVGLGSGLTLEAWINPTDITNYDPIFEWNLGDGVTYWGVHLYAIPSGITNTGFLYANVQDAGDNWHQVQSPDSVVTPNAFQHVALTYDKTSGVARLYRNGVVVAETTFGSFTPKTTGNLNIGNRPTDPANESFTFSGVIDEPSVYGRALSSNEIAAIYNAGSFGKCGGGGTNSGTAPVITQQPTNQIVAIGGTAAFSVTATGTPTLYYQWFGPTGAISGAATSMLMLSNVQQSAAASYFVLVTNAFGFTWSSNAALTVTGGSSSNSCTPAPSGIAAWWPGEGSGVDIIGGNTATLQGGATFAPGEVGQAFLLNGTNDYLSVPASSNLNVAAGGSLTAEAWIKVSDVAGYHPIVEWNDGAGHGGVHMWILPYTGESAGVLFANLVDTNGGSHSFHSPGGSVTTDVFQHVALTYDQASGIAILYVNGVVVAQVNFGQFAPQTSYPFWMGHRPNVAPTEPDYGSYLGGLLDEPSVYSRALSQSEIQAIYFTGPGGKCPPVITPHSLINPQPTINMSAAGTSPVLSWPVSADDFILQSADSLTPPIKWTNVPATLQTNGDTIEATLPEGGQHGFFRLYHP